MREPLQTFGTQDFERATVRVAEVHANELQRRSALPRRYENASLANLDEMQFGSELRQLFSDYPSPWPSTLENRRSRDPYFSEIFRSDYSYEVRSFFLEAESATKSAAAAWPVEGIFLTGNVGLGKTYAAMAIVRELFLRNRQAKITTPALLFDDIKQTFNNDSNISAGRIVDKYANADVLLIDDFDKFRGTEFELTKLFEVIDARYSGRRTTILTANAEKPSDLHRAIGGGPLASAIADRLIEMCGNRWYVFGGSSCRRAIS